MTDSASLLDALPVGTLDLAIELRGRGLQRLHELTGYAANAVDRGEVAAELLAPRSLDPDWPAPSAPLAVPGGAVHADVADDDAEVWAAVVDSWAEAGPEALSRAAQERRLPVTPYRRPAPLPVATSATVDVPLRRRAGGLQGIRVVDLTTLWAGPLCTALLAEAGAEVVKVDPSCRPDGFRDRPALYEHLNRGKQVEDLDLRQRADRDRFEELVARSDMLVSSFSRRVLPNLDYGAARLRDLNPTLAFLAVTAFPVGSAEQDWLAYGGGVHAARGLGMTGGVPAPAPVSYPDPLAGWAAFARALELLGRPGPFRTVEVALSEVVTPLLAPALSTGPPARSCPPAGP